MNIDARLAAKLLACALALVTSELRAAEVALFAKQDATLYEDDGERADGAGQYFFVGRNSRRLARRGLLAFDVAAALPAGAKVTDVELELQLTRGQTGATEIELHRVLQPWSEGSSAGSGQEGGGAQAAPGDATWVYSAWPDNQWEKAGGNFLPAISAAATVGDLGPYTWTGERLIQDVQLFLDHPEQNHGWLLLGEAADAASKRFGSHENSALVPRLRVSFDLPAADTGACCLPDGSCGVSLDPGTTCQGDYQGNGTLCQAGTCPEIEGACCLQDAQASCEVRPKSQCPNGFQGGLTSCEPNPCPVVLTRFVDALPRPAVAVPLEGKPGAEASYEISMVQLRQQLHRDLPPTTVWGFSDGTNSSSPGPTIEARTGAPVEVTWVNDLRDDGGALLERHPLEIDACLHGAQNTDARTVVHLHGGHVASAFDGNPELTLLPGEGEIYQYPNAQRAATLWYHDHALGITRLNVYMGLAGFYLLRDDEEEALGLPAGEYEVPLVFQDRNFNPDGSLKYPAQWQENVFGNTALVNGMAFPYLEVKRGKYRLRLLNGSTSRFYSFALSSEEPFIQIGNDGGLLTESFVSHVTLGPGERADVIVDFTFAPNEVILTNDAPAPFPSGGVGPELPELMKFVVGTEAGYRDPIPLELTSIESLSESDTVTSRDLVIMQADNGEDHCGGGDKMWTINGKGWDDITERPHLGTTEIWRFMNRSGATHPMHMHDVFFQVLDRQQFTLKGEELVLEGEPVRPERQDRGWKDTVLVGPHEAVRVIVRFEDFEGKFPYHCHILEHEDHGMMRQFETVAVCGDGALARGFEACDDGNDESGDGCSARCEVEGAAGGDPLEEPGESVADEFYDAGWDCSLRTHTSRLARAEWVLSLLPALALLRRRRRVLRPRR